MRDRVLRLAGDLGRMMADGLRAEPGAPERHRAVGISDAYAKLQSHFPECFEDMTPEDLEAAKEASAKRLQARIDKKREDLKKST